MQARQEPTRRGIGLAHVPRLESLAQTAGAIERVAKAKRRGPAGAPTLRSKAGATGPRSTAGRARWHARGTACARRTRPEVPQHEGTESVIHPTAGAWPRKRCRQAQGDWPKGAVVPQGRSLAGGKREETASARRAGGGDERPVGTNATIRTEPRHAPPTRAIRQAHWCSRMRNQWATARDGPGLRGAAGPNAWRPAAGWR